ncbi:hypothetical protein JW766_06180 [Candidatus Dojkabacteria bacterium]|nr:hypothetical protein [Candidatus Dojkabacteria bacterium]
MLNKIRAVIVILTAIVFLGLMPINTFASEAKLEFKRVETNNSTLAVDIYLDTGSININAVTADFTYPAEVLKVKNIDIENSLFSQFIEKDYSQSGTVYISCVSFNGISRTGVVARVTFEILGPGTAQLEFTQDVAVLDTDRSVNVLGSAEPVLFNVSEDLAVLPQTGTEEQIALATGLIALLTLVMIALFAIFGFTIWGGVYFSLGKWQVKTEGGIELGKKDGKGKGVRKATAKSQKKKKTK